MQYNEINKLIYEFLTKEKIKGKIEDQKILVSF